MTTGFKYPQLLSFPVDRHLQVTSGGIYPFFHGGCRQVLSGGDIMFYFFKEPGIANTGTPDHGSVQSVLITHFHRHFRGIYVPVSKYRDVHTLIVLDLGNRPPIGISLIHLLPGASVNGNGLDPDVLKTLSNLNDLNGVMIPPETGFYRYRQIGAFYHLFGKLHHQRNIAKNSGPGILANHLFYRTSEVDVDNIRIGFFYNIDSLQHGIELRSEDLNTYRTLLFVDVEFLNALGSIPDESFRRNELGIHHIGPLFLT